MYRILIATLICLSLAACQKQQEERRYTKEQFQSSVDSQFEIKSKELSKESRKDLELRKRIEIKPRVDNQLYGTPPNSPNDKMEDSARAIFQEFQ